MQHYAALIRLGLLFSALYVAFGVASPFLPSFLAYRHLSAEEIGTVLALGTAVRLLAGPAAGRLADRLRALRVVLFACTALAAVAALAFGMAQGFAPLLWFSLCHAAMLSPTASLSDALALAAAAPAPGTHARLEYGWVRGIGSAAFIVGTIGAGAVVNAFGPAASLRLQTVLLAAAAGAALLVPEVGLPKSGPVGVARQGLLDVLCIADFRWIVLVAALILGSHAMHDSFVMIVWSGAGISARTGGILWAESVAAEVLVFLWLGPLLLRHVRPYTGMRIAAIAAVLRWALTSQVTSVTAFAFIEPLHGMTFALLHLSCMRVLGAVVPRTLAATAQTIYAFGIGAMTAALTFASGWLYASFGPAGFWAMAALAMVAIPLIWLLPRVRPTDLSVTPRQCA